MYHHYYHNHSYVVIIIITIIIIIIIIVVIIIIIIIIVLIFSLVVKENAVWSELRAVGDKRRQVLEEDQASKQLAKLMEKNAGEKETWHAQRGIQDLTEKRGGGVFFQPTCTHEHTNNSSFKYFVNLYFISYLLSNMQ